MQDDRNQNLQKTTPDFRVVGAGLAGSEAALVLLRAGFCVEIWEQKPKVYSAAHKLAGPAELVCSNSFKSLDPHTAHGLLKAELELLGSPLIELAKQTRVPGGQALSIDREAFSARVKKEFSKFPKAMWKTDVYCEIPQDDIPTLIATGPLTNDLLFDRLREFLGEDSLSFYDATSPVVTLDSLDLSYFFWGARNEEDSDDYLNLPLTKQQYDAFREDLIHAEKMPGHLPEEQLQFFEGCLPIEVLAERGEKTLAFGPLKPKGFGDRKDYAVIQFRREKAAGELLNLVGFQTRMKWPEQQRVLRKLPGMAHAEFVRLGAMHRNSYINAPKFLNAKMQLKRKPSVYLAGQITGSEGYTEAVSTGHFVALQMLGAPPLPNESCLASLVRFLVNSSEKNFQPMNFNLGLLASPDRETKQRIKKQSRDLKRGIKEWKNQQTLSAMNQWAFDRKVS